MLALADFVKDHPDLTVAFRYREELRAVELKVTDRGGAYVIRMVAMKDAELSRDGMWMELEMAAKTLGEQTTVVNQ